MATIEMRVRARVRESGATEKRTGDSAIVLVLVLVLVMILIILLLTFILIFILTTFVLTVFNLPSLLVRFFAGGIHD